MTPRLTPDGRKIETAYAYPPIPDRSFDYSAVTEDYDGDARCPVGYGRTEEAAIADLLQQIEDRIADKIASEEAREEAAAGGQFGMGA